MAVPETDFAGTLPEPDRSRGVPTPTDISRDWPPASPGAPYVFVHGQLASLTGVENIISRYFDTAQIEHFEGEAPEMLDRIAMRRRVNTAVAEVCDGVGVDVRPRLLESSACHFFERRKGMSEAVGSLLIDTPRARLDHRGLFQLLTGKVIYDTATFAHETVRSVSARHVGLSLEAGQPQARPTDLTTFYGLAPNDALEESLNELVALQVAEHNGDVGFAYYAPVTALCVALVRRAATAAHTTPRHIYEALLRDKLSGTVAGQHTLEYGIGTKRYQRFGRLPARLETLSGAQLKSAARQLDLPEAIDDLIALERGMGLDMKRMPWRAES